MRARDPVMRGWGGYPDMVRCQRKLFTGFSSPTGSTKHPTDPFDSWARFPMLRPGRMGVLSFLEYVGDFVQSCPTGAVCRTSFCRDQESRERSSRVCPHAARNGAHQKEVEEVAVEGEVEGEVATKIGAVCLVSLNRAGAPLGSR